MLLSASCNMKNLSLLVIDEQDSSDSSDDDSDDIQFVPRTIDSAECTSFWKGGPSHLGQWEQHTRGIGGKLMAKMGYVHGSGLGKKGEGRIEPVTAIVFPPGRSLGNFFFKKTNYRIIITNNVSYFHQTDAWN